MAPSPSAVHGCVWPILVRRDTNVASQHGTAVGAGSVNGKVEASSLPGRSNGRAVVVARRDPRPQWPRGPHRPGLARQFWRVGPAGLFSGKRGHALASTPGLRRTGPQREEQKGSGRRGRRLTAITMAWGDAGGPVARCACEPHSGMRPRLKAKQCAGTGRHGEHDHGRDGVRLRSAMHYVSVHAASPQRWGSLAAQGGLRGGSYTKWGNRFILGPPRCGVRSPLPL